MRILRIVSVALVAGAACSPSERRDSGAERAGGLVQAMPCDSARATRVVIDSLDRAFPFRSAIFRYGADSAGIRVVTIPAPGAKVLDGMAIVRLDGACRITRVEPRDSA
jgi:hypothetical protein